MVVRSKENGDEAVWRECGEEMLGVRVLKGTNRHCPKLHNL